MMGGRLNQPGAPVPIKREDPLPDFAVMISVAPHGSIIKNQGGNEEPTGLVAYTQRRDELAGGELGRA